METSSFPPDGDKCGKITEIEIVPRVDAETEPFRVAHGVENGLTSGLSVLLLRDLPNHKTVAMVAGNQADVFSLRQHTDSS